MNLCVFLGAVADAKKKGEGLNTTIICQQQQLTQMDPPREKALGERGQPST